MIWLPVSSIPPQHLGPLLQNEHILGQVLGEGSRIGNADGAQMVEDPECQVQGFNTVCVVIYVFGKEVADDSSGRGV